MFLNSTGRRIAPEAAWAWDFLSQRRWSKHMEDRSRSRVPPAEAPDSHFLFPPRRTPDGLSNLFGVAPGVIIERKFRQKRSTMKPSMTFLFGTLLLAAAVANAQTSGKPAVQSHLAAARDAAYEPGNDLTVLYDTVCAPALSPGGPKEPNIQAVAESRAPQSASRAEWRTEPGKAFDNLYY